MSENFKPPDRADRPPKEFVTHKIMTTADTTPAQAERVQELVRIVEAMRHGKIRRSLGARHFPTVRRLSPAH